MTGRGGWSGPEELKSRRASRTSGQEVHNNVLRITHKKWVSRGWTDNIINKRVNSASIVGVDWVIRVIVLTILTTIDYMRVVNSLITHRFLRFIDHNLINWVIRVRIDHWPLAARRCCGKLRDVLGKSVTYFWQKDDISMVTFRKIIILPCWFHASCSPLTWQ